MSDTKSPFKVGETYKNGYGRDVRIVSDKADGKYPLIGIVPSSDGSERVALYTLGGLSNEPYLSQRHHLIPPKPETMHVRAWMNVYSDGFISGPHRERWTADRDAWEGRIACIRIDREVVVGEGLDDETR